MQNEILKIFNDTLVEKNKQLSNCCLIVCYSSNSVHSTWKACW